MVVIAVRKGWGDNIMASHSAFLDGLSAAEKSDLDKRLYDRQSGKCFKGLCPSLKLTAIAPTLVSFAGFQFRYNKRMNDDIFGTAIEGC
jgi:hypothetical protein